MGSDFVTLTEACKMLRRSERTVSKYMKQGVLRKFQDKGRTTLLREEVEELMLDIGANLPPMNKKTFFQLTARIQNLEQDVLVLKKMNGIENSPLRPTTDEAEALYQHAKRALSQGAWKLEEVQAWSELFDRLDPIFFDLLSGIEEPWVPFFQLCKKQMQQVAYDPAYKNTLSLQHLERRLSEGLKTLYKVILIWVELGHGRQTKKALKVMTTEEEGILLRLTAKATSSRG